MLITVAAFNELAEAHILRGRLWAEGIPSWTTHELQIANDWLRATARHGAWVQVSPCDAAEAWAVVRSAKAGAYRSALAEQFGDLDDPHCAKCGAGDFWKRRPIVRGTLALLFGLATNTIPPLLRWIYFCDVCGTRLRSVYGLIGKARSRPDFGAAFAEAAAGDIAQMLDVRRGALQNALRGPAEEELANYETILAAGAKGWVCRIGGVIRAFAIAEPATRTLRAVFVDPDFKRDGIGRHLHNVAVDWLFARGFPEIRLATEPGTAAERFFRKAGWRLEDAEENGDYRYMLEPDAWKIRRRKF